MWFRVDDGRVKLIKVNTAQCVIEVSKVELKDEGVWYFHIIQGRNLNAEWYLHKATVMLQNPDTRDADVLSGRNKTSENPGKTEFSCK